MPSRIKTGALAALAVTAALLPLRGDPQSDPITHPEWARMLLRGMGLDEALTTAASASRVFSTLSWRESLWLQAGHYMRADGVQLVETGKAPHVAAVDELGEVVYPISIARRGEYRLRAKLAGNPATPAIAEITEAGATEPEESYTLVPATIPSWLEPGEPMHLTPGTYHASFALPRGTLLEQFEIAPPCVTPIEPIPGWKPAAILDAEDLAVTMIKALDREHELAPADVPIEVNGSAFRVDETQGTSLAVSTVSPQPQGLDGLWLRAGAGGVRAILFVDLPEDGLYSMSAFGLRGSGMQWSADGCRTSVLCPASDLHKVGGSEPPSWFPVMSARFSAGRHFFSVTLAPDAAVERIRLERKKDTGADYVAALKRIGFDAGEGPVSRPKAADALDFLKRRYPEDVGQPCVEIDLEELAETQVVLQQGSQVDLVQPQQPPPFVGGVTPPFVNPPVEPPVGPPVTVPCVPPATPVEPNPCPEP